MMRRPRRAAVAVRSISSEEGGVRSVGTGGLVFFFAVFLAGFAAVRAGRLTERFVDLAAFFGRFALLLGFFFTRFLAIKILSNP
jgi:hypothetical protein